MYSTLSPQDGGAEADQGVAQGEEQAQAPEEIMVETAAEAPAAPIVVEAVPPIVVEAAPPMVVEREAVAPAETGGEKEKKERNIGQELTADQRLAFAYRDLRAAEGHFNAAAASRNDGENGPHDIVVAKEQLKNESVGLDLELAKQIFEEEVDNRVQESLKGDRAYVTTAAMLGVARQKHEDIKWNIMNDKVLTRTEKAERMRAAAAEATAETTKLELRMDRIAFSKAMQIRDGAAANHSAHRKELVAIDAETGGVAKPESSTDYSGRYGGVGAWRELGAETAQNQSVAPQDGHDQANTSQVEGGSVLVPGAAEGAEEAGKQVPGAETEASQEIENKRFVVGYTDPETGEERTERFATSEEAQEFTKSIIGNEEPEDEAKNEIIEVEAIVPYTGSSADAVRSFRDKAYDTMLGAHIKGTGWLDRFNNWKNRINNKGQEMINYTDEASESVAPEERKRWSKARKYGMILGGAALIGVAGGITLAQHYPMLLTRLAGVADDVGDFLGFDGHFGYDGDHVASVGGEVYAGEADSGTPEVTPDSHFPILDGIDRNAGIDYNFTSGVDMDGDGVPDMKVYGHGAYVENVDPDLLDRYNIGHNGASYGFIDTGNVDIDPSDSLSQNAIHEAVLTMDGNQPVSLGTHAYEFMSAEQIHQAIGDEAWGQVTDSSGNLDKDGLTFYLGENDGARDALQNSWAEELKKWDVDTANITGYVDNEYMATEADGDGVAYHYARTYENNTEVLKFTNPDTNETIYMKHCGQVVHQIPDKPIVSITEVPPVPPAETPPPPETPTPETPTPETPTPETPPGESTIPKKPEEGPGEQGNGSIGAGGDDDAGPGELRPTPPPENPDTYVPPAAPAPTTPQPTQPVQPEQPIPAPYTPPVGDAEGVGTKPVTPEAPAGVGNPDQAINGSGTMKDGVQ
jgi:hypothetical protein